MPRWSAGVDHIVGMRIDSGSSIEQLMNTIDGRLQLLNLAAPDEATVQRVTALLEDVMRTLTASSEVPGRVVVIRQLDVDAVPPAATPEAAARIVERAVQRILPNAAHGDAPAAATAPIVYFAHEAEAVVALARRVATN